MASESSQCDNRRPSGEASPAAPMAWLVFTSDQPGDNRCTVAKERFLIGSSRRCDLQLVDGLPALHSLIRREGSSVRIEAMVSSPAVTVNGQLRKSAALQDGDCVEIGPYQFHVVMESPQDVEPTVCDGTDAGAQPKSQDLSDASSDPSAMSASELVEQIEREQTLVEQFETGRKIGADALMHEIVQRAAVAAQTIPRAFEAAGHSARPADVPEPTKSLLDTARRLASESDGSDELLGYLDLVMRQLEQYAGELDRRADVLRQREAQYARTATALSDAQQQLEAQLKQLTTQLAQFQFPPSATQLRKAV